MGFRLTGLSNFYLFQNTLRTRNEDLYRLSEQLSTQKRINHPSDDPQGAQAVLGFKQGLEKMDQYSRNIESATRTLTSTESALSSVSDIIGKAKELAIKGKNGTESSASRASIADEIQQLTQQLVQTANTQINGQYIFGGYKTSTPPFASDGTFSGDTHVSALEIDQGATISVQVNGQTTFKGDGTASTVDLFATLQTLEAALRASNVDDTSPTSVGSMLTALDTGLNQVLSQTTTVGALTNRLDLTKASLEQQKISIKSFVSSLEDADMANLAFSYQQADTAIQATIKSAGSILNMPSLMEFVGR